MFDNIPQKGPSEALPSSGTPQYSPILSVVFPDTYYIYSFDGKLLAEHNDTGACVKNYIYAADRLIAEFQPLTNQYYYYMSNQINSTRIVTDDSGGIVYSEAYGPYGGMQKTWNTTYNPKQKKNLKT